MQCRLRSPGSCRRRRFALDDRERQKVGHPDEQDLEVVEESSLERELKVLVEACVAESHSVLAAQQLVRQQSHEQCQRYTHSWHRTVESDMPVSSPHLPGVNICQSALAVGAILTGLVNSLPTPSMLRSRVVSLPWQCRDPAV